MYRPWGSYSLLLPMVSSLYCLYVCNVIASIYMYKKRCVFNLCGQKLPGAQPPDQITIFVFIAYGTSMLAMTRGSAPYPLANAMVHNLFYPLLLSPNLFCPHLKEAILATPMTNYLDGCIGNMLI